jgi:hypothetical protein
LKAAFEVEHPIVKDIKARFYEYASISPKQEALVLKIADDILNPKAPEVKAPAPVGEERVTFRGTVLSVKAREGFRGGVEWKMTVKVSTAQGVWLAWGTCESGLSSAAREMAGQAYHPEFWEEGLKGAEVEITAKLQGGNDPHFAFFKRPKAKLLRLSDKILKVCEKVPSPESAK